jgi:hypothetical protein
VKRPPIASIIDALDRAHAVENRALRVGESLAAAYLRARRRSSRHQAEGQPLPPRRRGRAAAKSDFGIARTGAT